MTSIKKLLSKIYKFFIYEIFKLIYGNVNSIYDISQTSEVLKKKYLYQKIIIKFIFVKTPVYILIQYMIWR